MRNKAAVTITVITFIFLAVGVTLLSSNKSQQEQRLAVYMNGTHHYVWRDGVYIVYEEDVELRNNTEHNMYGYIIADIKRESEFVKEEFVYAYDTETGDKLLVFIPANSTIELRNIHFKATSINDGEALRTDREPLTDVIFEKVKMD